MTTQYKIFVQPVSSSKVLMLIKVSFDILKALSREIDLNKTIVFSKPILMSEFYFIKKSTDLCESADPAYWNEKLIAYWNEIRIFAKYWDWECRVKALANFAPILSFN